MKPLLLLFYGDQPLQVFGHAIELAAELGKLIGPMNYDSMGEIALPHFVRAFVEVVHRAGDVAGNRYPDDHRDELDHQEESE